MNPLERRTFSILEVAQVLGIGRTLAYDEARVHGTVAGVPVIRIGNRLLVSRDAIDRLLAGDGQ